MVARQHHGYHERRAKLIEDMGGECKGCGTCHDLEFDHIDPAQKTWVTRAVGRLKRIALYEQEFLRGLLQLLCRSCNARKAALDTNAKIRARRCMEASNINYLQELDLC